MSSIHIIAKLRVQSSILADLMTSDLAPQGRAGGQQAGGEALEAEVQRAGQGEPAAQGQLQAPAGGGRGGQASAERAATALPCARRPFPQQWRRPTLVAGKHRFHVLQSWQP